jgi:hypothetical protein
MAHRWISSARIQQSALEYTSIRMPHLKRHAYFKKV